MKPQTLFAEAVVETDAKAKAHTEPHTANAGAQTTPHTEPCGLFLAPWSALNDAALLVHYRGPRPVRYWPVADAEETRPEKIEALMQGRFEFNAETHPLPDPINWLHNPSTDIEWHILLHKFYHAVGLGLAFQRSGEQRYAQRWASLIDGWMAQTPPGFIAADVTGRRVQNWIYSLHLFVGPEAAQCGAHIDAGFHRRMLTSLHQQVEYLCAHLTPKRNHRTLELFAIFLAGIVFPEMARAAHWRSFALAELAANLDSDILPDGVHCELSTDYHHLVIKNALNVRRLASANGLTVAPALDAALQRGLDFSMQVHQPSGTVPSFSDGDARNYTELLAQGAAIFGRADWLYVATGGRQGQAPQSLAAHFDVSGYSILRSHWGDAQRPFDQAQHLVFDWGPLGEGNHGHFDCLSFELAAQGRALIQDPGRYTYSEAAEPNDPMATNWRLHFRGTAAHNTVTVDGRNQTRYAPRPVKIGTRHAPGSVRHKIGGPAPRAHLLERHHAPRLSLLHAQACSFEYPVTHERCMVFVDGGYWIVGDRLRSGDGLTAQAAQAMQTTQTAQTSDTARTTATAQPEPSATTHHYRLNFQLSAAAQGHTRLQREPMVRLDSPGLRILQAPRLAASARVAAGWVSTLYGHKSAAPCFQNEITAQDADFDTVLVPWQDAPFVFAVEELPVTGGADLGPRAPKALRLALRADGAPVFDHWFFSGLAQARHWHIDGEPFFGRWCFWRNNAQGQRLWACSDADAQPNNNSTNNEERQP